MQRVMKLHFSQLLGEQLHLEIQFEKQCITRVFLQFNANDR